MSDRLFGEEGCARVVVHCQNEPLPARGTLPPAIKWQIILIDTMDEAIKGILSDSGRSLAMQNYRIPIEESMGFSSAAQTISAIAEEVRVWKERTPKNHQLVVTMRTPDGRVMDVEILKAAASQTFTAEGKIMGMPCMIAGHIATLTLLCSYEETKGKSRAGFSVVWSVLTTEPLPTPDL